MTPRLLAPCLFVALAACVTTPEPAPAAAPETAEAPPPPPPMLPHAVQVVPSRLDPSSALNGAAERAIAGGFKMRLPPFLEPGRDAPLSGLDTDLRVLSSVDITSVFDRTADATRCRGRVEVVYLGVAPGGAGSFLRLSCHTEVLEMGPGGCTRFAEIGCPDGGDKVVGEIALAAARSL